MMKSQTETALDLALQIEQLIRDARQESVSSVVFFSLDDDQSQAMDELLKECIGVEQPLKIQAGQTHYMQVTSDELNAIQA